MQESSAGAITGLLPILLMSVFVAIAAHLLAKEKGRNVLKWTILGCIPFVNILCIWFFIGAANLKLERKIDELTALLHQSNAKP